LLTEAVRKPTGKGAFARAVSSFDHDETSPRQPIIKGSIYLILTS
jgi:hypothetical protein